MSQLAEVRMSYGSNFIGRQVEVLYQSYQGKWGRIRGIDAGGLWLIELDEGDQFGRIVLALESRAFRVEPQAA